MLLQSESAGVAAVPFMTSSSRCLPVYLSLPSMGVLGAVVTLVTARFYWLLS